MTTQSTDPATIPSIEQTCWRIDPARSTVAFRTRTLWGLATVKGHFDRYSGTLDLRQDPAITLTIDAGSVNTKNRLRDRHLRSADFFDVTNHPQVRFVSESVTVSAELMTVHGTLSAAGNTIPLHLEADLRQVGDELEVDATTDADHRQLGMSHGTLGMIPTPSQLIVRGRLVRDEEPPSGTVA